jgi:hypothetical protein
VLSHWGSDLRQTRRTVAVAAGIGDMEAHLLLNHKLRGVSAGYITKGAPPPPPGAGPGARLFADPPVGQVRRLAWWFQGHMPGARQSDGPIAWELVPCRR